MAAQYPSTEQALPALDNGKQNDKVLGVCNVSCIVINMYLMELIN